METNLVKRVSGWLIVLALFGLAGTSSQRARADEVYVYVGQPFSFADPPFTVGDRLTAYITLQVPLASSLPLTDISTLIIDFEFADGAQIRTPPDSVICGFGVATDETGEIVDWEVFLREVLTPGFPQHLIDSYFEGPTFDTVGLGSGGATVCAGISVSNVAYSDGPGTWSYVLFADGFESGDTISWSFTQP